jgi:membrane protein DedA with SNARE-associated domain
MTQLATIITTLAVWKPLGYTAVFFGLLLEGEIIIFTAFFLAHLGAFDLGDIILIIIAAVALNDLLWHKLGRSKYVTSDRILNITKKFSGPLDALIQQHPFRTFFITKFTYGLMRPTIIRSGMLGIPTEQFIKHDYPAAAIWIVIIGSLGYFASASLPLLKHYFKLAEIVLAIILVSLFIFHHVIIKFYLKKQTDVNS